MSGEILIVPALLEDDLGRLADLLWATRIVRIPVVLSGQAPYRLTMPGLQASDATKLAANLIRLVLTLEEPPFQILGFPNKMDQLITRMAEMRPGKIRSLKWPTWNDLSPEPTDQAVLVNDFILKPGGVEYRAKTAGLRGIEVTRIVALIEVGYKRQFQEYPISAVVSMGELLAHYLAGRKITDEQATACAKWIRGDGIPRLRQE